MLEYFKRFFGLIAGLVTASLFSVVNIIAFTLILANVIVLASLIYPINWFLTVILQSSLSFNLLFIKLISSSRSFFSKAAHLLAFLPQIVIKSIYQAIINIAELIVVIVVSTVAWIAANVVFTGLHFFAGIQEGIKNGVAAGLSYIYGRNIYNNGRNFYNARLDNQTPSRRFLNAIFPEPVRRMLISPLLAHLDELPKVGNSKFLLSEQKLNIIKNLPDEAKAKQAYNQIDNSYTCSISLENLCQIKEPLTVTYWQQRNQRALPGEGKADNPITAIEHIKIYERSYFKTWINDRAVLPEGNIPLFPIGCTWHLTGRETLERRENINGISTITMTICAGIPPKVINELQPYITIINQTVKISIDLESLDQLILQVNALKSYANGEPAFNQNEKECVSRLADELLELTKKANHITSERQLATFKKEFKQKLHSHDALMNKHFKIWKPLIANILVALTGLGLVVLAIRLMYTKYKFGRCSFFLDTTPEQRQIDNVHAKLHKLKMA